MQKIIFFYALSWSLKLNAESFNGLLEQFQSAVLGHEVFLPLALSLGAGFLTALSPCVYPLIPITLSVMGARRYPSKIHGFIVALSYTLGMALVYSLLGIIFASIGLISGSLMQHPLALLIFALIFLIMALSTLGLFRIALPPQLSKKLSHLGGQGIKGAFLMGLVAGLLAAPCTGPVLGVILTIIAEQKDILWGLALMLAFSLGLGAPFLILGTFSSMLARLPKSGGWMDKIKLILGALMMGVSLYYFHLAFPQEFLLNWPDMLLLAFLVLGLSLLLTSQMFRAQAINGFQKTFGVAFLALFVAASLSYEEAPKAVAIKNLSWRVIDEKTKGPVLERLLKEAKDESKPVLIDFYADWCKACKELEIHTFSENNVSLLLEKFMLIRVDSTRGSDYISKLQSRFQVTGLPTVVFLGALGQQEKIVGFSPPKQLLPLLERIVN